MCAVDYVEKEAEVCVPTFKTDCEREDVKNGLVIEQKEECYQVTKTVCTETDEISENEVCAYSFTLIPVETEVMLPLPTVWRNTDMSSISPLCYTQLLRRWLSSY